MLQKYGKDFSVTNLDKDKQIATLASGKTIHYDALISTMPLDITLTWLGKKQWADGLTHRCVVLSMHMNASSLCCSSHVQSFICRACSILGVIFHTLRLLLSNE